MITSNKQDSAVLVRRNGILNDRDPDINWQRLRERATISIKCVAQTLQCLYGSIACCCLTLQRQVSCLHSALIHISMIECSVGIKTFDFLGVTMQQISARPLYIITCLWRLGTSWQMELRTSQIGTQKGMMLANDARNSSGGRLSLRHNAKHETQGSFSFAYLHIAHPAFVSRSRTQHNVIDLNAFYPICHEHNRRSDSNRNKILWLLFERQTQLASS